MYVRRVVTGVDQGRSLVVSDELVDGIRPSLVPGAEVHALWGTNETPVAPSDGRNTETGSTYPPEGGFRFGLFNVLPMSHSAPPPEDIEAATAEFEMLRPGVLQYFEPGGKGMHTTPTVDVIIVLEGDLSMELDAGAEVELHTGDVVVQNGTRHAWRNYSDAPARLATVMVGARAPHVG